jgi:DNA-binding NarL/FixJ family response regulator
MPIKANGRMEEASRFSILIIDEDNLSRKGLRKLLLDLNWFTEIAETSNYESLVEIYDFVLICSDTLALSIIQKIKAEGNNQKIVVLLLHPSEEGIARLIDLEVNGIVLKTSPFEELIKCLQLVMEGRDFFSQEISTLFYHLWNSKNPSKPIHNLNISKREVEVLIALCNQKTNDEIAEELFLSVSSVKKYRCQLLEKTCSKTSAGLILFAVKHGIYKI